ncbi:MAG: M23 family metallopeptidase [Gemmatimonadales bacterium]|nr:MAG: M23 family metallopeptidase [Gemmatimonadales bacterium]
MFGENSTFQIISEKWDDFRQTTFESRRLGRILGGAGFFGISLLALTTLFMVRSSPVYENHVLQKENTLLLEELRALRDQVAGLEEGLAQLSEKDAELRILAGLDVIDDEVLQVGVGGPGSPSLENQPLHEVNPETGAETFAAAYDLHALERRARLLRESLEEASDSLIAHRDLLESTPSILPAAGRLTSAFSNARLHPIHNRETPHEGIDISAPRGTSIMAAAKGRVAYSGRRAGYGLVVEIDHGYGYRTLYGHASELLVRTGQEVQRGEVIARVGSTGLATSPHLHYEVHVNGRPVNPMNYVITGAVP